MEVIAIINYLQTLTKEVIEGVFFKSSGQCTAE